MLNQAALLSSSAGQGWSSFPPYRSRCWSDGTWSRSQRQVGDCRSGNDEPFGLCSEVHWFAGPGSITFVSYTIECNLFVHSCPACVAWRSMVLPLGCTTTPADDECTFWPKITSALGHLRDNWCDTCVTFGVTSCGTRHTSIR